MPRSFRGEEWRGHPEPGSIPEYKSRSMVEEYRGLAVVFAILALALTAYFIKSLLAGHAAQPAPEPSVYVDVVPPKVDPPAPR